MNEQKIKLDGDILHEKKYEVDLLEVISVPEEIVSYSEAVHVAHSVDLKNFCVRNKLPLFVWKARKGVYSDKEIWFTWFKIMWIYAYRDDEND